MLEINENEDTTIETQDPIPSSIMFITYIQKQKCELTFSILFDPGSKSTYINRKILPINVIPSFLNSSHHVSTATGTFTVNLIVLLEDLLFPEFSRSLKFEKQQAFVFDQPNCQYDVILGLDFLQEAQIDLCSSEKMMKWND